MKQLNLRRCAVVCAFTLLLQFPFFIEARAQQVSSRNPNVKKAHTTTAVPPRLVLLIAVDQFRYDYLERFGSLFVANGFRRLLRNGASWVNANYDHVPSVTAPGHATMLSGTWPAENGIIGNDWYDRESGKTVTSVADDTVKSFGEAGEPAVSPRRLTASTLGDELRLVTGGRSKVIGISIKDRSAILPVGRHASAAYWYSTRTGKMVSSNYYFDKLPAWVERFNQTQSADKYFGARWERLLPEAEYLKFVGPDAPAWEKLGTIKDTNTFPHLLTGGAASPNKDFYDALYTSPFANEILLAFAQEVITREELGADQETDLLSVSFSANDPIGHRFGPYSQEVMDVTLHTDRQIAALLDFVDRRIGLQNTLIVLTADHGVSPIPEHATALGLTGGRIKNADLLAALRTAISAHYGRKGGAVDSTADYITTIVNMQVYFNLAALKRDGIKREEIESFVGAAAMSVPGITRYFTRTQLEQGTIPPADPVARRVLHGFHQRRSGDVVLIYEPFKNPGTTQVGATHGSPYSYDTHVPLILMGKGLKAGRYAQAATPADIAPTLATILNIQPPSNTTGRVLIEGLTVTNSH